MFDDNNIPCLPGPLEEDLFIEGATRTLLFSSHGCVFPFFCEPVQV